MHQNNARNQVTELQYSSFSLSALSHVVPVNPVKTRADLLLLLLIDPKASYVYGHAYFMTTVSTQRQTHTLLRIH